MGLWYELDSFEEKKTSLSCLSFIAAGDLIAREAGAYTCDPSGGPLNLLHRCILCTASKKLAEQISPLLTHVDFPHD